MGRDHVNEHPYLSEIRGSDGYYKQGSLKVNFAYSFGTPTQYN